MLLTRVVSLFSCCVVTKTRRIMCVSKGLELVMEAVTAAASVAFTFRHCCVLGVKQIPEAPVAYSQDPTSPTLSCCFVTGESPHHTANGNDV